MDWLNNDAVKLILKKIKQNRKSIDVIRNGMTYPSFTVDFETGELKYNDDTSYTLSINKETGNLEYYIKES